MIYNETRRALDRKPFRPFRLIINGGPPVDVRGPKRALLSRSYIYVAIVVRNGIAHKANMTNLKHVAGITPLPAKRKGRTMRTGKKKCVLMN